MSALSPPWGRGQVIAHRGSRIHWPENTLVAFAGGLEAGADHLETDLRLTADGRLVCFHDPTVDRTTDGSGPVSEFTLAELQRLDAGFRHRREGRHPFRGKGIRVPTLVEVLTSFAEIGVVVDLKQDGLEAILTREIDRLDAWQRVIVGSFSDSRLQAVVAKSGGRALVSAGQATVMRWWLASRWGRQGPDWPSALQIPPSRGGVRLVDERLVEAAHRSGLAVHVWTVNRFVDADRLWDLGVDAVITDRVEQVRRPRPAA